MITKFSNVYAGHVDLGEMGQLATPVAWLGKEVLPEFTRR